MEQMEIFVMTSNATNWGTLKQHVNDWPKDHQDVKITSRKTALTSDKGVTTCVITIYYREKS